MARLRLLLARPFHSGLLNIEKMFLRVPGVSRAPDDSILVAGPRAHRLDPNRQSGNKAKRQKKFGAFCPFQSHSHWLSALNVRSHLLAFGRRLIVDHESVRTRLEPASTASTRLSAVGRKRISLVWISKGRPCLRLPPCVPDNAPSSSTAVLSSRVKGEQSERQPMRHDPARKQTGKEKQK